MEHWGFFPSSWFYQRDADEHKYFSQLWMCNGEQNGAAESISKQMEL